MTRQVRSGFSAPGSVQLWHPQTQCVIKWQSLFGGGVGRRKLKGRWTHLILLNSSLKSGGQMNRRFTTHPKHQLIPPGRFFLWDHLTLGHSEWSSNKHVELSHHQTSRQPVHRYYEVPQGCPHLLLVFNLSLWKDGNNFIPIFQSCRNSLFEARPLSWSMLGVVTLSPSWMQDQRKTLPVGTGSTGHSDLLLSFRF